MKSANVILYEPASEPAKEGVGAVKICGYWYHAFCEAVLTARTEEFLIRDIEDYQRQMGAKVVSYTFVPVPSCMAKV